MICDKFPREFRSPVARCKIGKSVLHLAQMSVEFSQLSVPNLTHVTLIYMPYVSRHMVDLFQRVVRCKG